MYKAFKASHFRPLMDKVFKFDQLKEAYDYSLRSSFSGKIVIRVGRDSKSISGKKCAARNGALEFYLRRPV
jgi:hypothetical protein